VIRPVPSGAAHWRMRIAGEEKPGFRELRDACELWG